MSSRKLFSVEANRKVWSERIAWYQPLFREALDGSVEGCIKALEKEPFITVRSKEAYGETPLHYAARGGQPEIAEFLLLRGANPNAQDNFGDTPLMDALKYSSVDVVEKLLLHPRINVKISNCDGATALHIASERGDAKVIQKILEKGADVDHKDDLGNTPLVTALSQCNLEAALALVDADADVQAWGMSGMSPAEILRLLEDRFNSRQAPSTADNRDIHLLAQLKAKIGEPEQVATVATWTFHEHFWRTGFDLPLPMVAQALAVAFPDDLLASGEADLPRELAQQALQGSDLAMQFLDSYALWQQSAIDDNFMRTHLEDEDAILQSDGTTNAFVEMRSHFVQAIDAISLYAGENIKIVDAASEGSFYTPPDEVQESFWRTSFGVSLQTASERFGEDFAAHIMLVNAQVWKAWNDLQEAEYVSESDYTNERLSILQHRSAVARSDLVTKLDAWHSLQDHILGRLYPDYSPQSDEAAARAAAISEMAAGLAAQLRENQTRAPPECNF